MENSTVVVFKSCAQVAGLSAAVGKAFSAKMRNIFSNLILCMLIPWFDDTYVNEKAS